ncbi:MAG: type IV toxin-antitoxin system AbiEi family antitoxin domain-containing protein [Candidatus Woesearchaeota archaeon]
MQLSKLEDNAYRTLRKSNLSVFTVKDLSLLLGINRTKAYNLIKALKNKEAIITIKSGKYSFSDINEFVIGAYLNWPSYVSFISALNYYHYSDNIPKKILYATTKNSEELDGFKYVHVSKKKFFGYEGINEIIIANKEKAFIDSLMFPKYSLGINHVQDCLKSAIGEIDLNKLTSYALQLDIKSVIRRLGYLLEEIDTGNKHLKYMERLNKRIGKGIELLDPSLERKNNLNKKWLLDINN